ncbi:acyltransferase family protein [Undibacterium sp. SXout11W]|uniref:acyltransferase family protein n=1 Tax=Undibacterium sp. SXout11W TaxID=3413050 RepID=UPI003BF2CBAB
MNNSLNAVSRLNGLDTLRALAISLVLMSHYGVVVSHKPTFGFLTDIGWMGVDLFFVLSGYLIGNQVISAFARGEGLSLKTFFARRLLRTLPNYYVVLALYFVFSAELAGSATAPIWRFLSFTQNIGLHFGETFSHSWSLCVEEQFYVILPLVAVMIAGYKKSLKLAWGILIAAILAGMSFRGYSWLEYGRQSMNDVDYAVRIYYSSFARFDELLPGVAIALLKNYHTALYEKITRQGNLLLALGATAFVIMAYLMLNNFQTDIDGFNFYLMTFGFSMLSWSFALLTLAALSTTSLLHKIRVPGAERLALWSYAIYLAHKPIFKLLVAPLKAWNIDCNAPLGISIVMGVAIVGGWLLYRLVETPFMNLRAKFFPAISVRANEATPGRSIMNTSAMTSTSSTQN